MAAADAIGAAAGANAIGGATPFGWASLVAGTLAPAIAGTPAGPSSALSGLGGFQQSSDFSGWTVSTGSSRASATAGDRGGMNSSAPGLFAGPGSAVSATLGNPLVLGALALVAVLLLRRK